MKRLVKKAFAVTLALSLSFSAVGIIPSVSDKVYAEETTTTNIAVDINGSENRGNLKSPVFADWTLTGNTSPATFSMNGVNFTLTGSQAKFTKSENKTLITGDYTPYLTTDGAFINADGATITLEISGLPAGNHTITTWHSYYNTTKANIGEIGKLGIYVDGVEKATVVPGVQVTDDLQAGIAFVAFEAKEGQKVTIVIQQASDSTAVDWPVLNAFEIDGVHPTLAIKNAVPEQNDGHHDPDLGLSWDPGDGAVSHDVYFGNDEYLVNSATTESAEYKGRQETTTYAFTEELSHMEDYYWRVDEIDANGNVVKGKVYHFQVRHLAFPTAEGYGRFAKGGRGGYVYEVTTLEDTGEEGSLRYGVETLKGARIIVFKVGGVINLKGRLCVPEDGGNVYIAGQTAPGDGITLNNYDFGALGSEDVVIRNVRVRVGDSNGQATGGMGLGSCNHCIVDHCSIAWSTDEGFSSRGAKNITFQNNIIAEALNESVHYGAHAFAASISGNIGSFHHNLLTNCTGRNWSLAGAVESDNKTYGGYLDISNNVVYNYRHRTTDGGVRRLNFVNNYYKMGPSSREMKIITTDGDQLGTGDCQMMYVSGNMLVRKDGSVILASTDNAWEKGYAGPGDWCTEEQCRSDEPFFPNYISLQTADEAYDTVLENAGAVVPYRDYLDSRYIEEVTNGTHTYSGSKGNMPGIIDSQKDVGGYPDETKFKGGEAPADTDHDGMPDEWETEHKLNPNDAADGSIISLSAEGYTNVEMYLNELMGDPLVWADGEQTNTPEPVETATPEPEETATPEPVETATPEPTESDMLLGDVNLDKVVDATDALLVLKHAAKLEILAEDACFRGNVDGVEAIDASDALWILKYAAKLVNKFPVQEQETEVPTDVPTATPEPEETATPEPVETATPEPVETATPEPVETATPEPVETATPEPVETATPEPVETATPEPVQTGTPDYESTALEVKSTNDAATVENGIITFVETTSTNGVLMSNPFAGKELEEGGTISFWYTPSAETSGAGLLTIVNNKSLLQFMRFDDKGTLQFRNSSSNQIYNVWSVDDKFEVGTTYFMTCVMSSEGMKYYVNGTPIAITSTSGNPGVKNVDQVNAAMIPLITNAETEIYIGGTTNIWEAMAPYTSHVLSKDTVVKDVTAYMDAMTDEEVKNLYSIATGKPVETPEATAEPEVTPVPSDDYIAFSGTVYIAGDSIADGLDNRGDTDTDIVGWGNIISNYFTADVTINNQANAGDSTESYYYDKDGDGDSDGSRYLAIYNNIKQNDYVIISFGHNDGPGNPYRENVELGGSDENGSFQWYIKHKFVEPALAVGATPILMTPIVRCFYENGVFTEKDYHLEYGEAYRDIVAEYAEKGIIIPIIDAQQYTYDLYQTLSESEAMKYHATNDTTHNNEAGSKRLCEYMMKVFKSYNMGINQYIK